MPTVKTRKTRSQKGYRDQARKESTFPIRLSCDISKDIQSKLVEMCKESEVPATALIRRIIQEEYDRRELRKLERAKLRREATGL